MSFDIYGNPLQRGHCEVHPHVHEEYPCSVCMAETRQKVDYYNKQESAYIMSNLEQRIKVLEEECGRLKEDNAFLHKRRGQLVIERDKLREELKNQPGYYNYGRFQFNEGVEAAAQEIIKAYPPSQSIFGKDAYNLIRALKTTSARYQVRDKWSWQVRAMLVLTAICFLVALMLVEETT